MLAGGFLLKYGKAQLKPDCRFKLRQGLNHGERNSPHPPLTIPRNHYSYGIQIFKHFAVKKSPLYSKSTISRNFAPSAHIILFFFAQTDVKLVIQNFPTKSTNFTRDTAYN